MKCPLTVKDKSVEQFTLIPQPEFNIQKESSLLCSAPNQYGHFPASSIGFSAVVEKGCKIVTIKFDPEHLEQSSSSSHPVFSTVC